MQAKKRLPLNLHISSLFLLVILIVGGTIGFIAHVATDEILRKGAQDKSNRIAQQMASNFRNLLEPSEVAVRLLATSAITEVTGLSARMKRVGLFKELLADYSAIAAVYVGYANGDFFLLRPIRSELERNKYNAPAETVFMVQSIEHVGSSLQGSYIFLDSALRELKIDPQSDYAKKYIPAQRTWYREAVKTSGVIITQPYLFFSNRQVGITIANQADNRQAVVAIDIQLDVLGQSLAEQKPTPNTEMAIVDDKGFVISLSSLLPLLSDVGTSSNQIQLKQLNQFNLPILDAIHRISNDRTELVQSSQMINVGNANWEVSFYPFSAGGDNQLMLIGAVPEAELLADAIALRNKLLLAGFFRYY